MIARHIVVGWGGWVGPAQGEGVWQKGRGGLAEGEGGLAEGERGSGEGWSHSKVWTDAHMNAKGF